MPAEFLGKVAVLWTVRETFNAAAFAIALLTLVAIVLLRRTAPRFPGLIVALGIASPLVAFMALPVHTLGSR